MSVVTRFAPSPTGFLHIGGARTALFNWCFARNMGGKFLIRIEDTDKERSSPEAIDAIFNDLNWLGLEADEPPVFQGERAQRHAEIAHELVKSGKAYYCYTTPEELDEMREKHGGYTRLWRERDASDAPKGVSPAIRIKAPLEGETTIQDAVQGTVTVKNEQLDDMILLRSDGTPTYMLAVVVDDHDMNITHIIRGDDHLNNTFRQLMIYNAMNWPVPTFAHVPLIHGEDGKKLSKRHGAQAAGELREMGYLPEAVNNYLLRLGWSHGDDELFTKEQAVQWFKLENINSGPARLDFKKLDHVNAHYIKLADNERLVDEVQKIIEKHNHGKKISGKKREWLLAGMDDLKARAQTLLTLANEAQIYLRDTITYDEKAAKTLNTEDAHEALHFIYDSFSSLPDWSRDTIESAAKQIADDKYEGKFARIGMPLRAALTGTGQSPDQFNICAVLGQTEVMNRLKAALNWMHEHGHTHHGHDNGHSHGNHHDHKQNHDHSSHNPGHDHEHPDHENHGHEHHAHKHHDGKCGCGHNH